METITLKIDGREISSVPGKTILEVATENGIRIPTLCHLEGLEVRSVFPARLDASCRELRGDIVSREFDTRRTDAPAFQVIAGEVLDVCLEPLLKASRTAGKPRDDKPKTDDADHRVAMYIES